LFDHWLGLFAETCRELFDDEVAAAASGVAVFRTKLLGFIVSAMMTAIAGTLYMQFYMAIDPEAAFGLSQAIQKRGAEVFLNTSEPGRDVTSDTGTTYRETVKINGSGLRIGMAWGF
jgi:hypothetical protein